jgi:Arm DNA-binding domain
MGKLTKRSIEALAPREIDFIAWDNDVPGFGVRVMPSGRKSFVLQYRAGRRSRRMVLGYVNVVTLERARGIAVQHLAALRQGVDPLGERDTRSDAVTVRDLMLEAVLSDLGADGDIDPVGSIWRIPDDGDAEGEEWQEDDFALAPYLRLVDEFCSRTLPAIAKKNVTQGNDESFFHIYLTSLFFTSTSSVSSASTCLIVKEQSIARFLPGKETFRVFPD